LLLATSASLRFGELAALRRPNFNIIWANARDATGLSGLHLHDLRHTGSTMAAATGASLRELMERMGHSSPRAALIYQHATGDRDEAIAAAMGEQFAAARRKGTPKVRSDATVLSRRSTPIACSSACSDD
jgi:integrase